MCREEKPGRYLYVLIRNYTKDVVAKHDLLKECLLRMKNMLVNVEFQNLRYLGYVALMMNWSG